MRKLFFIIAAIYCTAFVSVKAQTLSNFTKAGNGEKSGATAAQTEKARALVKAALEAMGGEATSRRTRKINGRKHFCDAPGQNRLVGSYRGGC